MSCSGAVCFAIWETRGLSASCDFHEKLTARNATSVPTKLALAGYSCLAKHYYSKYVTVSAFFDILSPTYGPGPYGLGPQGPYGPRPLIILKNILS